MKFTSQMHSQNPKFTLAVNQNSEDFRSGDTLLGCAKKSAFLAKRIQQNIFVKYLYLEFGISV